MIFTPRSPFLRGRFTPVAVPAPAARVRSRGLRFAIALVLGLALAAAAMSRASSAARPEPDAQFQLPGSSPAAVAALEADAREHGSVPVIVALAVSSRSPDRLGPAEEAAQRATIAGVRGRLLSELGSGDLSNLKTSDEMPLVAFHASLSQLQRLERSTRVAAITEDREIPLDLAPQTKSDGADPGVPTGAAPQPVGAPASTSSNGSASQLPAWWDYYRIGVDKARSKGYVGAGQTIAVLDTGVDRTHPWLSGKVVEEACFSTKSSGSTGGDCPNGANQQYGSGAAAPCTYSYDCAHGTHTAHTAAGQWGVASGASIIAVQIFHCCANNRPTYYESDLVWALSYVYSLRTSYRIAAVNMSIGGGLYSGYCDNTAVDGSVNATYVTGWINALKGVGIASVVASGNNDSGTSMGSPACISTAISVGNTTDVNGVDAVFGYVSYGSNSNSTLDLLAPGTDICSAVPSWLDTDGSADGVGCGWVGTSMATPHVAGAIAVLRAYRPGATIDQILSALRVSGTSVADSRNGIVRTRINVWNALFYI